VNTERAVAEAGLCAPETVRGGSFGARRREVLPLELTLCIADDAHHLVSSPYLVQASVGRGLCKRQSEEHGDGDRKRTMAGQATLLGWTLEPRKWFHNRRRFPTILAEIRA
jgi:hypothetical protein